MLLDFWVQSARAGGFSTSRKCPPRRRPSAAETAGHGTKLTRPIRRSYAAPENAMRKCARKTAAARTGKEMEMTTLTRRSVLRTSLGAAAAGTLARPHIANAAATTASVWWQQGFAEEEDVAFKKIVADYQKASGNAIDYSLVPYAPLRQK